jgi:hypothetical protein
MKKYQICANFYILVSSRTNPADVLKDVKREITQLFRTIIVIIYGYTSVGPTS